MFRFVEDVSRADLAFEAEAPTLAGLLREAGQAVTSAMVSDLGSVGQQEQRRIEVRGRDAEALLHKFLQELLYYKDAELLLFADFDVRVAEVPEGLGAAALARGERLDPKRHEQVVDVKAVTWHRFRVAREGAGWRALVVLDI
jgi:SHS2 domain-containing protein